MEFHISMINFDLNITLQFEIGYDWCLHNKKYNFFCSNMLEITRDFYENFEASGTYCIHVALGMTAFSLKHSKYNLP